MVQATLLFGAGSWVVYPRIGRTQGGFHHRLDRRLAKIQPGRTGSGRWIYFPLDKSMKLLGLEDVDTYFLRRQNTASQYITTQPILQLCLATERRPGAWVSMR